MHLSKRDVEHIMHDVYQSLDLKRWPSSSIYPDGAVLCVMTCISAKHPGSLWTQSRCNSARRKHVQVRAAKKRFFKGKTALKSEKITIQSGETCTTGRLDGNWMGSFYGMYCLASTSAWSARGSNWLVKHTCLFSSVKEAPMSLSPHPTTLISLDWVK